MGEWLPLLQIFLNSPTPEAEASLFFQNPNPNPSTSSFLSLLSSPPPPFSSSNTIFLQSLPSSVQSRVLSFLAAEHFRFCPLRLLSLAAHIIRSGSSDFWVLRSARNLLDALPQSDFEAEEENYDVFDALPQWIRNRAALASPLLPWLPLPPEHLPKRMHSKGESFQSKQLESVESNQGSYLEPSSSLSPTRPLSVQCQEKALALKADLVALDAASKAANTSKEIKQLCVEYGAQNEPTILGLIAPWEADDETSLVLLSNLSHESDSPDWLAHVLSAVILPKFLTLKSPASRVLLSAALQFSKFHPSAAVDALLFPLILQKEGMNVVLCDVVSRIVKECLNPSHISAFSQKLLCGEGEGRTYICLPCHRDLISDDLVWTESMFVLFQHILNQDVRLTPDTLDELVVVVNKKAGEFSKSLKFGNFLLCFVTKCGNVLKSHKLSLVRAAEKTDTFVTRSILAKLNCL